MKKKNIDDSFAMASRMRKVNGLSVQSSEGKVCAQTISIIAKPRNKWIWCWKFSLRNIRYVFQVQINMGRIKNWVSISRSKVSHNKSCKINTYLVLPNSNRLFKQSAVPANNTHARLASVQHRCGHDWLDTLVWRWLHDGGEAHLCRHLLDPEANTIALLAMSLVPLAYSLSKQSKQIAFSFTHSSAKSTRIFQQRKPWEMSRHLCPWILMPPIWAPLRQNEQNWVNGPLTAQQYTFLWKKLQKEKLNEQFKETR